MLNMLVVPTLFLRYAAPVRHREARDEEEAQAALVPAAV